MFGIPSQTPLDIRFVLFRIPITIHPFFWLIALILASHAGEGDARAFAVIVLAVLIAILIHELGHALVIRNVFGAVPWIMLHGFGGLTYHNPPYYYRTPKTFGRIFISFAGPLAGFILSFICWCIIRNVTWTENMIYLLFFLSTLFEIGVFWGILNLLPVYPLDGGQIFREFFVWLTPMRGYYFSAVISVITGIVVVLWVLKFWPTQIWLALIFGLLAYQNYTMIQTRRY